jgi:hypothetical protein
LLMVATGSGGRQGGGALLLNLMQGGACALQVLELNVLRRGKPLRTSHTDTLQHTARTLFGLKDMVADKADAS